MKKCLSVLIMFSAALYIGCGDDDGGGNGPITVLPRLQASTTAAGDLTSDAMATIWNTVDSLVVDVSSGNPPAKIVPSQALAFAPEVNVRAVNRDDTLFLWLQWTDASHSVWPAAFEISAVTPLRFLGRGPDSSSEDQVFVMFEGGPNGDWDIWSWRALTTDAGFLAEGMTWDGSSLDSDDGELNVVIGNNTNGGLDPKSCHRDSSEFDGHIIYLQDKRDSVITIGGDSVSWRTSDGWEVGQKVPGYLVDTSMIAPWREEVSRWDTRAVSDYDSTLDQYTLVLYRKLNTGFGDDKNLATVDSVKVQLGVLDNLEKFTQGGSGRGFSEEFWIIF